MVCLRYNFCETKDTLVLHPHDKRTILSKLYNTLLRLLSTKYVQNFQKFVFSLLTWKGVIIGKASSRVLTFTAGFRQGSRFAKLAYIASCTAQQSGIPVTFRKMLRNRCLYQMARKGIVAR